MTGPAYPAARAVAGVVEEHFARQHRAAEEHGTQPLGPLPDAPTIEAIIDAAFWASLVREEGASPKISLAYLPPEQAGQPLRLEQHKGVALAGRFHVGRQGFAATLVLPGS